MFYRLAHRVFIEFFNWGQITLIPFCMAYSAYNFWCFWSLQGWSELACRFKCSSAAHELTFHKDYTRVAITAPQFAFLPYCLWFACSALDPGAKRPVCTSVGGEVKARQYIVRTRENEKIFMPSQKVLPFGLMLDNFTSIFAQDENCIVTIAPN